MPSFSYKDVIKRLKKLGFVFWREAEGSHEFWNHPDKGTLVLVPRHNKNLKTGTVARIAKTVSCKNLKEFENILR